MIQIISRNLKLKKEFKLYTSRELNFFNLNYFNYCKRLQKYFSNRYFLLLCSSTEDNANCKLLKGICFFLTIINI